MNQRRARHRVLRVGSTYAALVALLWLLAACVANPLDIAPPVSPPAEMLAGPLIGKTWRVEQITYQGAPVRYDWKDPVRFTFTSTGTLQVDSSVWCSSGFGTINYFGQQQFRSGPMAVPAIDCAIETVNQGWADCEALVGANASVDQCAAFVRTENERFGNAIRNTNHYSVEGDRLTLTGPDAEIRLVLEAP